MVQETPSRKLDQYIIRFPDGMRDRLKGAAAASNRSLNAEIIDRLEQSFEEFSAVKVMAMQNERIEDQARTIASLMQTVDQSTDAIVTLGELITDLRQAFAELRADIAKTGSRE